MVVIYMTVQTMHSMHFDALNVGLFRGWIEVIFIQLPYCATNESINNGVAFNTILEVSQASLGFHYTVHNG
jgi:hypothetical protein